MDKSAIQEIAKLATANEIMLHDHDAICVPDGYELLSLEKFDVAPDHFRGTFSTTVLSEFTAYINSHGDADTGVFVNQEAMCALAIIDMGHQEGPRWGKHRADIKLLKTPAYTAVLKFANAVLLQQDFIDFAEDWQDNVQFYFEGTEAPVASFQQTIKVLRRLKVNVNASSEQNAGNFSASRSALETIEIKAGNEELPAGFRFSVIPYEGFDPVLLNCQLRAVSDDKNIKLKYRIGQQEIIAEAIANQFREKLINGIKAELNGAIFIGRMEYQ